MKPQILYKFKKLSDAFRHLPRTFKLAWELSPSGMLVIGILTAASILTPLAMAWVGKLIIDATVYASHLDDPGARRVAITQCIHLVILEMFLAICSIVIERINSTIHQSIGAKMAIHISSLIINKSFLSSLSQFEDPSFYDQLNRARREANFRPLLAFRDTLQIVRNLVLIIAYSSILLRFDARIAIVLVLATVPPIIADIFYSTETFTLLNNRSPGARQLNYLEHILTSDRHAKETKLFGLGLSLFKRYRALSFKFYREDISLARKRASWHIFLTAPSTVVFYVGYITVAVAAASNTLSLGSMTLYIVAFRQTQLSFESTMGGLASLYEHNLYLSNLFKFLDLKSEKRPTLAAFQIPAKAGIFFKGVGFRYPGAMQWTIRNFTLAISPGESVAIVGPNGSGKTTLIKLLSGLYAPSGGEIYIDGVSVSDYPEVIRQRIAVVFQDFNCYQASFRENVGFGSIEHLEDHDRIVKSSQLGGASEVLARLSAGLDTQLGRWFEGGTDLSGGEWQKVAISRAFMRRQADIVILDEPTASLDVDAEQATFERIRAMLDGRTSIIISHRFGTVRMADRIVVMKDGGILEQGSHLELVEKNGEYARLFRTQAKVFEA